MNDQFPIPPQGNHPEQPIHAEVVDYPSTFQAAQNVSNVSVDTGAVITLVLAILSWIALPVVAAIAALAIAPGAKRRIRRANGALGSTSIVTAAQIIAGLNLLAVIALATLIVALVRVLF